MATAKEIPAKFRGAEFQIDATKQSGGRRQAVHEYPSTDKVEVEDLGLGARRFSLDGFVIGADYRTKLDRLIAALEAPGPGTLVRPDRADLEVSVDTYEVTETIGAQRMATVSMSFIQAMELTLPASLLDTSAAAEAAADAASLGAQAQFTEAFNLAEAVERRFSIDFLFDSLRPVADLITDVRDFADAVERGLINGLLNPLLDFDALLDDINFLPGDLANSISGLVGRIGDVTGLNNLFDRSGGSGADGVDVPGGSTGGSSGGVGGAGGGSSGSLGGVAPPGASATTVANRTAIARLVRTAVAIRAAAVSARVPFKSYDAAIIVRDQVTAMLDAVSPVADDVTYTRLQALRASVVTDIGVRAADLARITRYTPRETLPAIVIAQQLYGTTGCIARADEIVERNGVPHPGFVSGGVELEVLTP